VCGSSERPLFIGELVILCKEICWLVVQVMLSGQDANSLDKDLDLFDIASVLRTD
jgi:hypothetical protein